MSETPHINADTLRKIISYNPKTGEMSWKTRLPSTFSNSPKKSADVKCRVFNKTFAGKPALSHKANHGYFQGNISGKLVYAHRAAWAIYYGEWPHGIIDHINGDGFDNRIENLRDTSQKMNMRNRVKSQKNSSKHVGIRMAPSGRWIAVLGLRPKALYLGTFDTQEEAIAARIAAEKTHGFTKRHCKV
jgi:hypothetical protein